MSSLFRDLCGQLVARASNLLSLNFFTVDTMVTTYIVAIKVESLPFEKPIFSNFITVSVILRACVSTPQKEILWVTDCRELHKNYVEPELFYRTSHGLDESTPLFFEGTP